MSAHGGGTEGAETRPTHHLWVPAFAGTTVSHSAGTAETE